VLPLVVDVVDAEDEEEEQLAKTNASCSLCLEADAAVRFGNEVEAQKETMSAAATTERRQSRADENRPTIMVVVRGEWGNLLISRISKLETHALARAGLRYTKSYGSK